MYFSSSYFIIALNDLESLEVFWCTPVPVGRWLWNSIALMCCSVRKTNPKDKWYQKRMWKDDVDAASFFRPTLECTRRPVDFRSVFSAIKKLTKCRLGIMFTALDYYSSMLQWSSPASGASLCRVVWLAAAQCIFFICFFRFQESLPQSALWEINTAYRILVCSHAVNIMNSHTD